MPILSPKPPEATAKKPPIPEVKTIKSRISSILRAIWIRLNRVGLNLAKAQGAAHHDVD